LIAGAIGIIVKNPGMLLDPLASSPQSVQAAQKAAVRECAGMREAPRRRLLR
jgi:hypothetical protein